ncbi:hypothetical protein ACT3UJ_06515 [Halomonas sp. 86]|uniref:hypothetical protein n=1 Tax=unclassified Halomonas TaxID=2609666 RepID=UPI004034AE88
MSDTLHLRGKIKPENNSLSFLWSSRGSRNFPKAMVSNAENILRFIALGYRPIERDINDVLDRVGMASLVDKPYTLQAVIDSEQHSFLYQALKELGSNEEIFDELVRIHDLWVISFGLAIYKENPIKSLLSDYLNNRRRYSLVSDVGKAQRSTTPENKGEDVERSVSTSPRAELDSIPDTVKDNREERVGQATIESAKPEDTSKTPKKEPKSAAEQGAGSLGAFISRRD